MTFPARAHSTPPDSIVPRPACGSSNVTSPSGNTVTVAMPECGCTGMLPASARRSASNRSRNTNGFNSCPRSDGLISRTMGPCPCPRVRWHQESDGRSDFDEAGHVPEPLADADPIEQCDHRRRPRELGPSCQQEHAGERELHRPERDESNAAVVSVYRLKSG